MRSQPPADDPASPAPGGTMTTRPRRTVLITGFGPFPGHPQNASALLARLVAEAVRPRLPGYDIRSAVLPVEWKAGPARVRELIADSRPVLALHFGVSRRATRFAIEQRAVNAASESCDAAGELPGACEVATDGPTELASTLPVPLILERLRRLGIPAQLSRDAGRYLCNAILYTSLADARRSATPGYMSRRGFVHVPADLVGGGHDDLSPAGRCRLDWNSAVRGGVEIVSASLGR